MAYIDFINELHTKTQRNYIQRVIENDKSECAIVAKRFGEEYWDGDRRYGYGGYQYDGRWYPIAQKIAKYYNLKPGNKVLDVCCGKGYLLYELMQVVPGIEIKGLDISQYAIKNSKEEIKNNLTVGDAVSLPFKDKEFDLVISLGGLHNLPIARLFNAIREIERVGRYSKYIMVESWRNEKEKVNLLYWQLTCESFYSVSDWEWIYIQMGYTGDWGFIFFE